MPTVMAAMTFFTASFFFDLSTAHSSCLSSWISPARERGKGEQEPEGTIGQQAQHGTGTWQQWQASGDERLQDGAGLG